MSGNKTLKPTQRAWVEIQLMVLNAKPKGKPTGEPDDRFRDCCISLIERPSFDKFIMYCIMANTSLLAFQWYMQPASLEGPISVANYVFILIFTAEAIIKIFAMRTLYFKDSWNRFDFFIVCGTAIILVIKWIGVAENLDILATIIRTLRICRVLRLIKRQEKLQEIFSTLVNATPAMGSVGVLLMLIIFMFSIIGMSSFSLINLDGAAEMGTHVNFQSFGTAFLTLLRCSTGEAWNSIMFDSSQQFSILYNCNEGEDFDSIVARGDDPNDLYGPKGCGNNFAIAFHISF